MALTPLGSAVGVRGLESICIYVVSAVAVAAEVWQSCRLVYSADTIEIYS